MSSSSMLFCAVLDEPVDRPHYLLAAAVVQGQVQDQPGIFRVSFMTS